MLADESQNWQIQSFAFSLMAFAWHEWLSFYLTWQTSIVLTKSNLCIVLWIKASNYLSYRLQRKSIKFFACKIHEILTKWLLGELQIANVNSFCTLNVSFLCLSLRSHSILLLLRFTSYSAWLQLKAIRMEYYHLHSLASMISYEETRQ